MVVLSMTVGTGGVRTLVGRGRGFRLEGRRQQRHRRHLNDVVNERARIGQVHQ